MRISVNAIAEVTYACWLNEEDSRKVVEYMLDNDVSIEEAVEELYARSEISLYRDCTEVDFGTREICDGAMEYDEEDE